MNNSNCPDGIANDEPRPSSLNDRLSYIDEGDISVLCAYELDDLPDSGLTLVGLAPERRQALAAEKTAVGLGPARRQALAAEKTAEPESQRLPASEPPGPWGSDEDSVARSVRPKRMGIWSVALPGLVILAGAALVVLRALGPAPEAPKRDAAVVPQAVVVEPAGLAVPLTGVDVRVFLDGQDRGRPPLVLTGLTPGSHALSITGPAYAAFEQPVTLVAGRVSTIEPTLTFVRGAILLALGEGADVATVEVVGANERRAIELLPAQLEVAPGDYVVRAKRPGFPVFESNVTVSAATPQAQVLVEFVPAATPTSHPVKLASASVPETTPAADEHAPTAPPSGTGALSITSSPPSNIVLDGRPLGKAPRNVDVPPGSHTVVFVHPQFGRQSLTVKVEPGKTVSASADF